MKLDRLVSILVVLLRREKIQAKELAQMFDVSVRTILRDVDAINLAGIPIVTYQGVNGGIGIAEGYRLDRSVLTSDEMAAIISTLRGVSGSIPDSRHEVLLEKFNNLLPSSQLEALNAKANQLIIDMEPWGGNGLLKNRLKTLRKAVEDKSLLQFYYLDSSGEKTKRKVEPYSLVLKGQNWYLYAWCLVRQDFRLFRLSRMREEKVLPESFMPREVSLEKMPWDGGWYSKDETIEVELVFDREMAAAVEAWFGEDIEKLDYGKTLVRLALQENNQMYGYLLSFGPGLEVVRPVHVRRKLAEAGLEIFRKYSGDFKIHDT